MIIDETTLNKLINIVLEKANNRRESAAYSGSWHDGGYSDIVNEISYFRAGIAFAKSGTLPNFLEKAHKEYLKETDLEFKEYCRLKEKFE